MNSKHAFTALVIVASTIAVVKSSPALAQSSGCGSGYSWYLTRAGSPVAASQFRVACNEHDACYDTLGKSKQECDKAFHNRMLDICARDHNTIAGILLKRPCNGRADAYYTGVRDYGQDAYSKAQAAAKPPSGSIGGALAQGISLRLVLDANGGTGNLYLNTSLDTANPNHRWKIWQLSNGNSMIISRVNGAALDSNAGTGALYLNRNADENNPNQQWRIIKAGSYYMITSRLAGYALDANGGTGNLYMNSNRDTTNTNLLWKIVRIGDSSAIGSALKN